MKILQAVTELRGILIDCDGTLHNNHPYMSSAREAELNAIAQQLGVSKQTAQDRLQSTGCQTRTESVLHLGLSAHWWNTIRIKCYQPKHLQPDRKMFEAIANLATKCRVAITSNNPSAVTIMATKKLSLNPLTDQLMVLGPDNLGVSKHDPLFFRLAAQRLGLQPQQCISVGDRKEADGAPAIAAGCGAIIVSDTHETLAAFRLLALYGGPFDDCRFTSIDHAGVKIDGVTGRAGAGKTTFCKNLCRERVVHLPLDAFFKMSSRQRKVWLAEGKAISPDEYAARANQLTWWDFDMVCEAIESLRAGQPLHLRKIYNREDNGELTGRVDIEPHDGLRIKLEGVAIAHLKKHLDHLTMLHAPPTERYRRLRQRDANRRQSESEAKQRFLLTEAFEDRYFRQFAVNADLHVDNGNGQPVVLTQHP